MLEASFGEVVTAIAMCGTTPGSEVKLRLAAPMDVLRAKPIAAAAAAAAAGGEGGGGGGEGGGMVESEGAAGGGLDSANGADGGGDGGGGGGGGAESDGDDSDTFFDATDASDVSKPWDTAPVTDDASPSTVDDAGADVETDGSTARDDMVQGDNDGDGDGEEGVGVDDAGGGNSSSSSSSTATPQRKHSTVELQIKVPDYAHQPALSAPCIALTCA